MTEDELFLFLQEVDSLFPIKLSEKINLKELCSKFLSVGTIFSIHDENKLVALLAGYNNDFENCKAYISVLAVLPKYQGKGYASKLILDFTNDCINKKIKKIELFTHKSNENAIRMYKKNGFIIDSTDSSRINDIKFYKDI